MTRDNKCIDNMEKGELLCSIGGIVNYEKQLEGTEKLKIKPPYPIAFPLPGVYPKEMQTLSKMTSASPCL